MALIQTMKTIVNLGDQGPTTYHCDGCDRTFEVDAPPERVICSDCGNEDVQVVQT